MEILQSLCADENGLHTLYIKKGNKTEEIKVNLNKLKEENTLRNLTVEEQYEIIQKYRQ